MATSSFLLLLSIISFLASTPLSSATFSPSSVASTQLKFWSNNVQSSMPEALFSKLSPLSMQDSSYFASLISQKSFSLESSFCSQANLACSVKFENLKTTIKGYGGTYTKTSTFFTNKQIDRNSVFRISILQKGNRVQLPNLGDQFPRRAFLPSHIASSIPFSLIELRKLFPESFSSPDTKHVIQSSLQDCNAPALKGVIQGCSKSLEDMIEFSQKVFGQKHMVPVASKSAKGSGTQLSIGNIKQIHAQKVVSCHEVFLPFATYFCHTLSSTRLYRVDLINPETRAPVNSLVAVCHIDTSAWPKDILAFKILKASPGEVVCHWLSQNDLVWVADGETV